MTSSDQKPRRLVLATANPGKVRELQHALKGLDIQLIGLDQLRGYESPAETGDTFADNALIKARAAAMASGLPALADDSGLEVDALDGGPGVYSARYGGPGLSDADRCLYLLRQLERIENREQRTARFKAVLALVIPGREPVFFTGTVEGWIGPEPKGSYGFGYDPIFYLRDPESGAFLERSMAELPPEEKAKISHRSKAVAAFIKAIESGRLTW